MYSYDVRHDGLGKYQVVRGRTESDAREKAEMKKAAWNSQYERLVLRDRKQQTTEDRRAEREALKEDAAERTAEAEKSIADLKHVLVSVVDASPVFEIAKQKIVSQFSEYQP